MQTHTRAILLHLQQLDILNSSILALTFVSMDSDDDLVEDIAIAAITPYLSTISAERQVFAESRRPISEWSQRRRVSKNPNRLLAYRTSPKFSRGAVA